MSERSNNSRLLPLAGALLSVLAVAAATWVLCKFELDRYREKNRAGVMQRLGTLRARIESSLNKRIYLSLGLAAHVSCNPGITRDEFEQLALVLMSQSPDIRSETLIKDNVISHIYPYEPNKKALGFSPLNHPDQRDAVLNAIQKRVPLLTGPVHLVQGGEAFISRVPVFETPPGGPANSGRYWGLASVLFDTDQFFEEVFQHESSANLHIVLHDSNALGGKGKVIYQTLPAETSELLELEIDLPGGTWLLQGAPEGGWPTSPSLHLIMGPGIISCVIVGSLVYLTLSLNQEYRGTRESSERANAAKSSFLARMSHEIRTPMTAILGYTDLIIEEAESTGASKECLQNLETIRRNGHHLLQLINDILDISKIESDRLVAEMVPTPLAELLADVESLMRVQARGKKLNFEVCVDGPIPRIILTDPVRLKQILVNLVGNAVKFTEEGSVILSVACVEKPHGQSSIRIRVTDTGIGISADNMAQLYTPFGQGDVSTTRRFGGTGLGLTISKRLVELLGGTIHAHSEQDLGTTFEVELPIGPLRGVSMIEYPHEQEAITPAPRESTNHRHLVDRRILLAEDGDDNRRLVVFLLEREGAVVETVENGLLAVEATLRSIESNQPYDLILMDMQMPEMDGYAATQRLRKLAVTIPIVALTANAMDSDRKRCLEAGCDEFASKPIQRKRLITLLQGLLPQNPP